MPENNSLITIKLNDGRTEQWTPDQYEKNKEKLYEKFPDAEAVRTSSYNPEEGYDPTDTFGVRLNDGRVEQWTPDQMEKNYDRLVSKYPDAQVVKVSDMSTQYWKPKADEALGKLQALGGQNSDFERKYTQNLKQALALDTLDVHESPYHDFVAANKDNFDTVRREREELRQEYFNNPWVKTQASKAATQATQLRDEYRTKMDEAQEGGERRDWRRAAKLQDDIRKIYEAPNKYVKDLDDDNGFAKYMSDYATGAVDKFTDQDFYTFGLSSIARNFDLRGIAEKIQNAGSDKDIDQILTPSEKAEIVSFYQYADAQRNRADSLSGAYTAGQSFADSVKFMAEFLLSTGVANAAGKALSGSSNALASWLGRQLMSERALNAAGQVAAKGSKAAMFAEEYLAKPIIQGLWHTGTQLSSLESISDALLDTDSNGNLVSVGQAIGKGVLDSVVENWSESFGGAIEKTLALPFQGLGWAGEHTIGKTGFGRLARWVYNSAPVQIFKEAGFNGMIGEIGEEWAGNAVRVGLGLMKPEEFKDFASWEQQLEMAASFAPMSLLGLGGSSIAAVKKSNNLNNLSGKVRGILERQGRSEEEINNLFNTRFDTAEDIGKKLAPYLRGVTDQAMKEGATAQEYEDYRTILDFAKELGLQGVVEEIQNIEDAERRQEVRNGMEGMMGKFWQEQPVEEGQPPVETVRVVKDGTGETYYVVGVDENGLLITVGADGSPKFQREDQLEEDNTYSMDEFLQGQVDTLRKDREAARMNTERMEQIDAVRRAVEANPVIPMGTEEAPKNAVVVASNNAGVHVVWGEEGMQQEGDLTWNQVAQYLGTPIDVKTDAQLEEEAAIALDEARERMNTYKKIAPGKEMIVMLPTGEGDATEPVSYRFEKAVLEDGQVMFYGRDEQGNSVPFTEEMVENIADLVSDAASAGGQNSAGGQVAFTDEEGNLHMGTVANADNGGGFTTVTMADGTTATVETDRLTAIDDADVAEEVDAVEKYTDDSGKVNQNAFMEHEPEEWAKWNDTRRQDGGANTRERINASLSVLDKEIKTLTDKKMSMPNPDDADALEEQIVGLQDRRNRLQAIADGYAVAPAVAGQTTAQAQPAKRSGARKNQSAVAAQAMTISDNALRDIQERKGRSDGDLREAANQLPDKWHEYLTLANRETGEKKDAAIAELVRLSEQNRGNAAADAVLAAVTARNAQEQTDAEKEAEKQKLLLARVKEWEDRTGQKIEVVTRIEDVKDKMAKTYLRLGKPVKGWFNEVTGRAVIYLPNAEGVADIDKTYMHEVVSHKGLKHLLGEEQWNQLMDNVYEHLMTDKERAFWRDYNSHLKGDEDFLRRAAADEYVAHLAEKVDSNPTAWEKFVAMFKAVLDKLGLGSNVTVDDLKVLLQASLANYERERAGLNTGALSRDVQKEMDEKGLVMEGGVVMDQEHGILKRETGYQTPNELDATGSPIVGNTMFSISTVGPWAKNYLSIPGAEERVVTVLENLAERMSADELVNGVLPTGTYKYGEKTSGSKAGPLRTNIAYVVTFDMDTSCPRTLQYLAFVRKIESRIGRPLTQTESIQLIEMMRAYGQNIPCVYCYCENKRQALKQAFTNYITSRHAVISAKTEEEALAAMYGHKTDEASKASKDPAVALTSAAYKVFQEWRSEKKYNPTLKQLWAQYRNDRNVILSALDDLFADGSITTMASDEKIASAVAKELRISDKKALGSVEELVSEWKWNRIEDRPHDDYTRVEEDDRIVDNRTLALWRDMTLYGKSASGAKNVLRYVPYTDELKTLSKEDRDYINGMGGLRMHSSNDFRIDYVFDYFQFMADMAANKMFGHTYTKSPEFVQIFGNSGYKINMSIAAYEDSYGIRQNMDEGFDWRMAKELREKFPNAGTMLMATSDAQIQYALDNDWVDMCIPFHHSGLPKAVWYNMRAWTDYSSTQEERFLNGSEMRAALEADGVDVPKKAKAAEIERMYLKHFNIVVAKYQTGKNKGKRMAPHFLPGPTVVDGVEIPGHNNDYAKYLELCRQWGVHPRFEGLKVRDNTPEGGGRLVDITEHPRYMILIKETSRTDSPQTAIEFNFDQPSEALGGVSPIEYAFNELQTRAMAESEMAGQPVKDIYESLKQDQYGIVDQFINTIIKHKEDTGKDYPLDYLTPDSRKWFMTERRALEEAYKDVDTIPYHPHEYDADGNLVMTPEDQEQIVSPQQERQKTGEQILNDILDSIDKKAEENGYDENAPMQFRIGDPSTEVGNTFFRINDGTLVGLHNISEDKLRKADKAGGLANPSAAVIDITKQEHNNFGEISLVMPSSMVSATSGRNVGTYLGDAWTPTFPSTQKKMSKVGQKAFDKQIMALPSDVRYVVENAFNNHLEDDRDGNALRWWFLQDTGRNPAIVHYGSPYSEEDAKTIGGIDEWDPSDDEIRTIADLFKKYAPEEDVRKATTRFDTDDFKGSSQFVRRRMQEYNDEIDKYGIHLGSAKSFIGQAKDQLRRDGRLDDYTTMDTARQFIEDNNLGEEFRNWLDGKEDEFGVETKLFAGWDRNGYRKWIDYTAENASKLMNKEDSRNAYSDNGLSATHALLVRKMRTLADIKKNKDLLVSRAEYDERYDQVDKELHNAISTLDNMQKISDNPFSNYDYTASRLQEALTKANPVAYLNNEYKYTIPEDGEYAEQLDKLKRDIMDMPVNYFETKFNRPVGLSEFTSAVVPSNLDEKTRKILEDAGVKMFEYDPKQEGSRRDATMQATEQEGIRFRITPEQDKEYLDAVERGDMEKAQQMVRDAAALAMPNTKVVDEDGKPMVVYHGTHVFNTNGQPVITKNGMPFTVFYEDSHFGNQQQAADMQELREGDEAATRRIYAEMGRPDFKEGVSHIYPVFLNIERMARAEDQNEDWDSELEAWKKAGYDGVVYSNEHESEGDSFVAFRPSQIKSAEPVTYDDNGNVIPLSERFNPGNEDIRFRVAPMDEAEAEESAIRFRTVTDPLKVAELEAGEKETAYRAGQFIPDPNGEWEYDLGDGKGLQRGNVYPPMSAQTEKGEWRDPIRKDQWEKTEEAPDKAILKKGKNGDKWVFRLWKGNGKYVDAAYNPYFHSSETMLNDQFAEAQNRGNLVVMEVMIPKSQVDENNPNPYHAEKAKDHVGKHDWKAGPVQQQLTGTRKVNLTQYDKPHRLVPVDEVATNVEKMIRGQIKEMPTNVVWPQLRAELEKLGVPFVETNNKGIIQEGEHKGENYQTLYSKKGKKAPKKTDTRFRVASLESNYDGKYKEGNYTYVGPKVQDGTPEAEMLDYIMGTLNGEHHYGEKPWDAIGYVHNYISDQPELVPTWTEEAANKFQPEMFLTKEQLGTEELIRSDSFKKWFGDWEKNPKKASKVVDEDGKPLVVYHGTRQGRFTKFNESTHGIFFTSDPGVADDYAYYDNDYGEEDEDAMVVGAYLDIKKPFVIDADYYDWKTLPESYKGLSSGSTTTDGWARYLMENHPEYDGLIVENVEDGYGHDEITTVYAVFKPTQIKSADGTTYDDNGNPIPVEDRFDDESNDIRFLIRGYDGVLNAGDYEAEDNLNVAEEMEKAGKDSQTIWLATGWEKGADGRWRNEIPDAKPKAGIDLKAENRAGDIIDAPEMFKSYPQLEDMPIKVMKLPATIGGSYDPINKLIKIDKSYATDEVNGKRQFNENGESTLLHEIQHAIQYIDGFSHGSNKNYEQFLYFDKVRKKDEDLFTLAANSLNQKGVSMALLIRAGKDRYVQVLEKAKNNTANYTDDERRRFQKLIDRLNNMTEREYVAFVKKAGKVLKESKKARENYFKVAGEVEARNVQKRVTMAAEERKRKPLESTEDVLRENQILRFRMSNDDQKIFVSNAEKAVEEMKMDKATPEQWKKTLEKNGGLKAAEDKWLGLSTWLDSLDKKTVTKQEVLDFIKENQIQIEETHYSEEGVAEEEAALKSYQDEIDEIIAGNGGDIDAAWNEMIDRYGDDFDMAFTYNVNPGNDLVLEPTTDWNGEPSDAARYFIEQRRGGSEKAINFTRKGYTTEGLRNLHEIALTVPTIEPWNESDQIHFGDAGEGRAIAWARFGDTWTSKAKDEAEKKYREADKAFRDYRNEIVAKYAVQATGTKTTKDLATEEENAKVKELQLEAVRLYHEWKYGQHPREKVLVIDEIQSKRHQEGREKGYRPSVDEYMAENGLGIRETDKEYELYWLNDGRMKASVSKTMPEAETEEKAKEYMVKTGLMGYNERPAPAPFEKNWPELTMKRMLRYAAEFGYDTVAWTTGEQQAERYSLSKVVERVNVNPFKDGSRDVTIHLSSFDGEYKNMLVDENGVVTSGEYNGQKLSAIVGADLATKIMGAENREEFEGEDLKVGGEGMNGFYDDILVRFMNKYGKKWGVKVEDIFLPNIGDDAAAGIAKGLTMHSVPVTQEMKESVMQGQTMFRLAEEENGRAAVEKAREGGIDSVIGKEDAGELYMGIYRAAPEEARIEIANRAIDAGMNVRDAVSAYVSDLAERGDNGNGMLGLAETLLKDYAGQMDDASARYILWRGDDGVDSGNVLDVARDRAVSNRMGVGNDVRFRTEEGEPPALEDADKETREAIDQAKKELEQNKKDLKDLLTASKAMNAQKEYDKKTVEAVANLAKKILRDQSIDALSRREVSRLLGIVRTSVGKSPRMVKKNADAIVNVVIDHLLAQEKKALDALTKKTGTKTNATGVEVQGELDIQGQKILKAFKDGLRMDVGNADDSEEENTLYGRRAKLQTRLASSDDAVRKDALAEDYGLALAIDYKESVKDLLDEESNLRSTLKDLPERMKETGASKAWLDENIQAVEDSIRQNRIDQIEAYRDFRRKMMEMISGSVEAKKSFLEREEARKAEIQHLANSDMQGRPASMNKKPGLKDKLANSALVRFLAAPLATFDQMLRLFGEKSVSGEGYLHNRFMGEWIDATEKAYLGRQEAMSELDKKASEVFGKDMRWVDLGDEVRKQPKVKVSWWDDGKMTEHELTQGQLLYIYMVNKMADGRMKLRWMGILDEDVDAIKKQLDPRFVELADWLQDEYLVNKRNKYNDVHERLFGASMAAIENYFPLVINKRDLNRNEDIGLDTDFDALPSSTTGAIIKRRKNNKALDLQNADAFAVAARHVEQMEDWAAFAEFNKDINALLSYKRFRNQVQNMASVYGSGNVLWKNFKDVARIAGNAYKPASKKSQLDTAAVTVAKGATSAKITFRVYTALKQVLSLPAFVADANIGYLVKSMSTPWKSWNWAMENLPMFEKRWKSRIAGDTRLMDSEDDWWLFRTKLYDKMSKLGMSPNAFVDAVTVSVGAKAMYDTKKKQYLSEGFSEEQADKKAKKDATTLYNETQQSSEGAFVSAAQLDRTMLATAITVFRNSSMGFQRQVHDAIRNLGKHLKSGYKEESIAFMTKQLQREGLTEEQAKAAAERRYGLSIWRDATRVATFGFLVQFAWNLGSSIVYLLFGDDDDKKQEMLLEAFRHAVIGGTMEGLSLGNVASEALNMIAKGDNLRNYDPSLLPIISDMKKIYSMMGYDAVAGANELVNLGMQTMIGVNPQTFTDAIVAVVDASRGDLGLAREAMLCAMRVLQVPQSQIDEIYIDELGMTARNARRLSPEQMARRYAEYKLQKGAPVTGWAYSEANEQKRRKSYEKKFKTLVKERNTKKK